MKRNKSVYLVHNYEGVTLLAFRTLAGAQAWCDERTPDKWRGQIVWERYIPPLYFGYIAGFNEGKNEPYWIVEPLELVG